MELDGVGRRPDTELGSEVGAELLVRNDDLVTKVEQHVAEAHPELDGKMTREDVLGMAVEDD
ncbi:MAG: hypothetical protein OEW31_12210 [Thermoleophilia bacterium]|nr:hypothetical protein [Thermoleophilia bacterium]MDH4347087.1 hypothetical protein [Thermoleophilia bacterium]MDH5332696.1 hypothetical protein [Thermoleophilia bacterium]